MNIIAIKHIKHCPFCMNGTELVNLSQGVLRCMNCQNAFRVYYPPQEPPFVDLDDPFHRTLKKPPEDSANEAVS